MNYFVRDREHMTRGQKAMIRIYDEMVIRNNLDAAHLVGRYKAKRGSPPPGGADRRFSNCANSQYGKHMAGLRKNINVDELGETQGYFKHPLRQSPSQNQTSINHSKAELVSRSVLSSTKINDLVASMEPETAFLEDGANFDLDAPQHSIPYRKA